MKRRALVLTLCALALGLTATPVAGAEPYLSLVQRYRVGDRDAALRELLGWPRPRVSEGVGNVLASKRAADRCPECPDEAAVRDFPYAAAAMLHTDCALLDRENGGGRAWVFHLDRALDLLGAMPDRSDFQRRWFFAVGQEAQAAQDWAAAERLFEAGLRRFSTDPDLLLALGSFHHTIGSVPSRPPKAEERASANVKYLQAHLEQRAARRERLVKAHDLYRRALAADPDLDEAHLRLGRVLSELKRDGAQAELEWVLGTSGRRHLVYLAHLFQGRIREDAGDLAGAARAYRAATSVDGGSQAALLALSHVLHQAGNEAGSREALERALANGTGPGASDDPWWLYRYGVSGMSAAILRALRQEASS